LKPSALNRKYAHDVLDFIRRSDNFLLSAHINADGDAIAAMIAVNLLLEKLGKTSRMVLSDQRMDSRFLYLKNFDKIMSFSQSMINPASPGDFAEAAILLDVPGYKRLGDVTGLLPDKSCVVKIDHHPTEDEMGTIDWADEAASSTTALVYEVIELSGIEPDVEIAKAIFTGIAYDTGRFSFSNTTSRDFNICARMIELGAKPSEITNQLFFENSFLALKTIGKGLASLENHLDGQVNIIYLGLNEMIKNNQNEIEELANYSVAIRGGKIGLFIREIEAGLHKVSFRSKCDVDVNVLAKAFNGGGHARAAGCRIAGTKQQIISSILHEIKKQL
jgi:phosphoesterase RecJ-like protein